ncbi:energy transducer TonB family protein [Chryseobacterium luquanense]|uniref:Energy transducer TonB n=1 Tax=Chryseobacterium luquanense TaxID=2983766 RepID=A0ABT3Y5R2_9FLAO|nr:energy transducer TonB [Chryseobacterium luquanense]MCX8533490.1 energy transducer TonB [Chryseobacterium luquanense]
MKVFSILLIFSLLTSCTIKQKQLDYYLSTGIENIKIFPANKEDSLKINSMNITANKSYEECRKLQNQSCIDDRGNMILYAIFLEGISNFRMVLFNNFKLPKNALEGENRIRITVGINNTIENIEILKYTDENTLKAIQDVFKIKELNTWKSARIYNIPVKEQFEISVFVIHKY